MNKYIDLHCHSTFSDGDYSVDELVQMAKNNNVWFFSITDHDKVDAFPAGGIARLAFSEKYLQKGTNPVTM